LTGYFPDTSAVARLYHEEIGSDYVESILESILNQPGSKGIVSRLSLVEMESVFAIKVRTARSAITGAATPPSRHRGGSAVCRTAHRTETLSLGVKAAGPHNLFSSLSNASQP